MNKITSILFLYITFLPAFSYAAFPNNIMTDMAGALYTNQSAHATNTDEYDELKKTVTECVNKTKQKNKSAPENYITNRANELKKNALTRNINYSTHVDFSTNDRQPKKFTCNITAKVGDFLKDKPQVQKVAPTTFNNIPTETAKQKCYETIARMVASDDWYVKECLTNKIKKDYGIQDVDDYYKKMYSPFTSAKKSNNTKVASAQKPTIEPEHIDAPIYNDTNQSTVANFAPTSSMLSTDTNTQQQYKKQIEEPTNQAIDLCKKSGGDWEQNTCNCEKYGMEYDKQKLRCTHTEIPSEKRSYQQQSNDFTPKRRTNNEITTNDATTLITVSVVDHYDSNKKIKDIEICYENIESCETTTKTGTITFTHNHIATEKISPKISVKTSSGYHCDKPINTSDSMNLNIPNLQLGSEGYQQKQKNRIPADNTSFNFVVKCKQLCTDKDLKKVPNATACYVRGKKDYEILRCAADYTNIDNKCEPNPKLPVKEKRIDTIGKVELTKTSEQKKSEEQLELASEEQIFEKQHTCNNSKSTPKPTWDGTECICPNTEHVFNYNNGLCEELKTNDELCTDSGGKWKKNKATCDCPKNKNYNPNTRKCEDTNAEEICKQSGGDWNGKKCKCDENKGLTRNKNTGICECTNTTYKYNTKSKKCTKTAQDIAIDNEFDRQNRIKRLRDACENSGGSYDQISEDIADSYICNCQTDQTLNTQSGLCECTESGYRYSQSKQECIAPDITMEDYKEIENLLNTKLTELNELLDKKCSDQENQPEICNKKDELIDEIKNLNNNSLEELKKHGKKQFE